MSKGRNTTVIGVRLPDSIVLTLQKKAQKAGLETVGEYIKSQILKSLNGHSVNATEAAPKVYRKGVQYKPGELMKDPATGKVFRVPELDADGNPIPDF